jgi:hypothetical protein
LEAARLVLEDLEKSNVTEIRYVPSALVTALKADGTYRISVTLLFSKSSKTNLMSLKSGMYHQLLKLLLSSFGSCQVSFRRFREE